MSARDFARCLIAGVETSKADDYIDRVDSMPQDLANLKVLLSLSCWAERAYSRFVSPAADCPELCVHGCWPASPKMPAATALILDVLGRQGCSIPRRSFL